MYIDTIKIYRIISPQAFVIFELAIDILSNVAEIYGKKKEQKIVHRSLCLYQVYISSDISLTLIPPFVFISLTFLSIFFSF